MVLGTQRKRKVIDVKMSFDSKESLYVIRFQALGSDCLIRFSHSDRNGAVAFAKEAVGWIAEFETKYSRFRDDSIVSEINRAAGVSPVPIDAELESIFAICDDLHFMTDRIMDPSMLPLIELWDFRKREGGELPTDEEVAAAQRLVGWDKVERKSGEVYLPEAGMSLDFGGFGKEYAVDKVAAIAVGHGVDSCLVDLGRDLHVIGTPPRAPAWHVALEDPQSPGKPWSSLACLGGGVATSGDYRRFFESNGQRYGHIIDPRSGRPTHSEVLSVTVLANSCLEAGVLSTAAFIMGQDEGGRLIEDTPGAEGCFFMANGINQTRNFYSCVVQ